MKYLAILLMILAACTEDPVQPKPVDPYAEYYWLTTQPDWPEQPISNTYTEGREGFTLTPDSLILQATPNRSAWSVKILRNGNEVWASTPKREWVLRGVIEGDFTGKIIGKQVNGKPGPIQSFTMRVQ